MPRVKRGVVAHKRHKKVIAAAAGYRGRRSKVFKVAKPAVLRAGQYAYRDRRRKKRDFRAIWIVRVNAAARANGLTYSKFMGGLRRAGIIINRKTLSTLALSNESAFGELAQLARQNA